MAGRVTTADRPTLDESDLARHARRARAVHVEPVSPDVPGLTAVEDDVLDDPVLGPDEERAVRAHVLRHPRVVAVEVVLGQHVLDPDMAGRDPDPSTIGDPQIADRNVGAIYLDRVVVARDS